jgi:hypothetical protein
MENPTKFLVYCIEIYKTAYKLNGKQVMMLFCKYKILDYIVQCYSFLMLTHKYALLLITLYHIRN